MTDLQTLKELEDRYLALTADPTATPNMRQKAQDKCYKQHVKCGTNLG